MQTITEYGTYEHGRPYYSGVSSYRRSDTWIPNDKASCKDISHDLLFAASMSDQSPIYLGPYNGNCSCCWLGFGHTTEAHKRRIV
jgi:hypothetical protein